jgi:hypothetical protein
MTRRVQPHELEPLGASGVQSVEAARAFEREDAALRRRLTDRLYEFAGHWIATSTSRAIVVGAVSDAETGSRTTALMAFTGHAQGVRRMSYVELDEPSGERRGDVAMVELTPPGPSATDASLPFEQLLTAIAAADPASSEVRRVSFEEFARLVDGSH